LASGVGLFAAITTFIAGLLMGNYSLQLATVALIGALLGFLRYNFNPASIFLGDSGSLAIGFLLGCYGIVWSQKASTILGMTAPLIAFSIPLLDTALAVVRRLLRGQPIFGADRRHIHHLLLDRGLTPRRVALLLYGVCAIAAVFALTLSVAQHCFSGLVIVIFCVSAWIGIQHLGYIEFNLAGHLANPQTFRRVLGAQLRLRALEDALIRAQSVESCWSAVRDASHGFGFDHVSMRLDHTVFEDSKPGAQAAAWSLHVPLSSEEFVRLERGFDSPIEPMIIEPLADLLRRTLTPKLPAFQWPGGESRVSPSAAGPFRAAEL
jgi:UDP-GlcNAc:undecaprenyl-phosphate GlcNAc-1-phosphate transferase